jgi:hypothetical protein
LAVVFIAVASLADEIGLLFGLAFLVAVFFELLLPIRDFFVTAMVFAPEFEFDICTES